jgi:NAD(P)-dependent dehydrogenase (short-subunit alcohol dehydrogenase family)
VLTRYLAKKLGPWGITANVVAPGAGSEIHSEPCPREVDSGFETDRRRVESVVAMFFGAALGAVVIHYSISAALRVATTICRVQCSLVSLCAHVR